MADYITLMGADDVRSAGHSVRSAADDMRSAASTISEALWQHQKFMDRWLAEFKDALETAALAKQEDRTDPLSSEREG